MLLSVSKGPALAGLFFALTAFAAPPRLPASDQKYFRSFLEHFTPLVIKTEKNKGHYRPSAAAKQPVGNYRWGTKNRDCAGLVRYLFWEAMQVHDHTFFARYPQMSALDQSPAQSSWTAWTQKNNTAADLVKHATYQGKLSDTSELKTGDLLYFASAELKIRHVMLVIRSGASVFLVYHTGDARDELRIRTLPDIIALPENEWHPEPSNPVFQGVYRPSFLD